MTVLRIILFVLFVIPVWCQPQMSFKTLDSLIGQRSTIQQLKIQRINSLKKLLPANSLTQAYEINEKIYSEYKSFIYDSAFQYALNLQRLANRLKRPDVIMKTRLDMAFILASSGLFHEALDTLSTISPKMLNDKLRPDFYFLVGRTCYDLADFTGNEFYGVRYTEQGSRYLDSALALLPDTDARRLNIVGLLHLRNAQMENARRSFEELIDKYDLSDQQLAVATSTLSFIYRHIGETQRAKDMLVRAAIADIRSSTKETVAMLKLAELLLEEDDIEKAYIYIKIAIEDANFYGARHRKVQVASVYPIIEGKQLNKVQTRKNLILLYALGATFFILLLIVFAVVVYKQFKKLQQAKSVISEANEMLTQSNHQLLEATKIKEEYITYYFNTTADYISKLENLKKQMEMKLITKKIEDLRFVVDSINIKRERDELYHNFDKVFLKLFPDFVDVFQSLFKEEDRVHLKEGQLLNTELRIFALIRMGIHDNEKISRILDYSVTTIYTYKTRLRNKSIVPNEEFDKRIMGVKAI